MGGVEVGCGELVMEGNEVLDTGRGMGGMVGDKVGGSVVVMCCVLAGVGVKSEV